MSHSARMSEWSLLGQSADYVPQPGFRSPTFETQRTSGRSRKEGEGRGRGGEGGGAEGKVRIAKLIHCNNNVGIRMGHVGQVHTPLPSQTVKRLLGTLLNAKSAGSQPSYSIHVELCPLVSDHHPTCRPLAPLLLIHLEGDTCNLIKFSTGFRQPRKAMYDNWACRAGSAHIHIVVRDARYASLSKGWARHEARKADTASGFTACAQISSGVSGRQEGRSGMAVRSTHAKSVQNAPDPRYSFPFLSQLAVRVSVATYSFST